MNGISKKRKSSVDLNLELNTQCKKSNLMDDKIHFIENETEIDLDFPDMDFDFFFEVRQIFTFYIKKNMLKHILFI